MEHIKIKNSKILFICTTDNMIWQFLVPHIKDLISYGAKVDCVCSKTGFWFDELSEKYGLNMIELPMKRMPINLTNWKAYRKLKKLHRENKYDLIYCQQPTGGLLGRFIGKKFKLPVIYTAHGFFFFKGNNKLKNLIFKSAEKYMAKFTDILITMNDEDFNACQKWKAKNKYKIDGIGLDLEKYQDDGKNLSELKAELGIEENQKVILSVSEFIPRKNYPTMLRTVKKLYEKRNDFKYLICGTGRDYEEMKSYAKDLGIENVVNFLGYRRDVNKLMKLSDVFFHQSFQEGLTMGIIEAMQFSLPVVTSDVRGNRDLIEEGGGFITNPLDEEGQARSLNILLDDQQLRNAMGQYNKDNADKYLLENVQTQLFEIYKENNLI